MKTFLRFPSLHLLLSRLLRPSPTLPPPPSSLLPLASCLLLLLAACSPAAPAATPTAPAAATDSAAATVPASPPTFTPVILPSAVPPPTALPSATAPSVPTPAVTPTPDPNQGVGEVAYADPLDGSSTWGWGYTEPDAVTFSTGGGQLNAVMSKTNIGSRFTIGPETVSLGDQQIRFIARANLCYERDEYGLAFRTNGADANGNSNGYLFKLNCSGQARLELMRDGQVKVLVDWTANPAIVSGAPAENAVLIWAAGGEFRAYVNDKYLFSANDDAYATGGYAFFLRDRTAGGMSVGFSKLEVRELSR